MFGHALRGQGRSQGTGTLTSFVFFFPGGSRSVSIKIRRSPPATALGSKGRNMPRGKSIRRRGALPGPSSSS
eukprot:2333361-Prymnesium_polylepis.1